MTGIRQQLYLIADELRGLAALGRRYAGTVSARERAERVSALATRLITLADGNAPDDRHRRFDLDALTRSTPVVGVEAAVFNRAGSLLLVQRADNRHWALPGGYAEIGETLAAAAVRELWEEGGMRGHAVRLLGVFDGPRWGTLANAHLVHLVFLVEAADGEPVPGSEMLDARFFRPDQLPEPLYPGHDHRIPKVIELVRHQAAFFDPATSEGLDLSFHQRPARQAPDSTR